jgi:glucokinase
MLWAPNNAYRDWAIRDELERETGLPAVVDNDANVAGFAEARAGRTPYRQMLFVTVGTGIGGGSCWTGDLPRPDGHGRRARTHDRGSAGPPLRVRQTRLPGGGLVGQRADADGREAAAADPDGLIARMGRADGVVTGQTVTAAAEQDDAVALDIFTRLGRWLGIGIASLATIFELEAVVIGGGVIRDRRPAARPGPRRRARVRLCTRRPRRTAGHPGDLRQRGGHDRCRAARARVRRPQARQRLITTR